MMFLSNVIVLGCYAHTVLARACVMVIKIDDEISQVSKYDCLPAVPQLSPGDCRQVFVRISELHDNNIL